MAAQNVSFSQPFARSHGRVGKSRNRFLAMSSSPFTEVSKKRNVWMQQKSSTSRRSDFFSRGDREANMGLTQPRSEREESALGAEDGPTCSPAEDPLLSNDISFQLPELREVLKLIKDKHGSGEARNSPGKVFLVGTGPGDPELLTVKAMRLIQTADLVLYDRLVSMDILDMVHPEAKLLYVGKTAGYHSRTQEEIHELLLAFAEAGATVVRLKGGDPMVFGRGGEEMDFLKDRGINVQIIPGITAASGIAALLGIPLTQRGVANSVRFLTGHSRKGGEDPLYVAESAADPDSTLVIYMGLQTLPGLVTKLLANGLDSSTPSVAIERGTTAEQRTVFAELSRLPSLVEEAKLVSPTLIFIGKVVALSPEWPSDLQSPLSDEVQQTDRREPRDRTQRGPDPALPSQSMGKF